MVEPDVRGGEGSAHTTIDFSALLAGAKNYHDVQEAVNRKIRELRERGMSVGFVSGPVGVYTPGLTDEERKRPFRPSMQILDAYVQQLQREHGFPVFSCKDIFTGGVWDRLEETKLPPEQYRPKIKDMFNGILRGGVTDVFMAPGWKLAEGAQAEHATATELGLRIQELPPLPGRGVQ